MPFPESKSTSPPQHQFKPIFTRLGTPSPEAQQWVEDQTKVARSMSRNLHEQIAKKRAASAPLPNIGGTRKRRRRKHKKRRKTKRR